MLASSAGRGKAARSATLIRLDEACHEAEVYKVQNVMVDLGDLRQVLDAWIGLWRMVGDDTPTNQQLITRRDCEDGLNICWLTADRGEWCCVDGRTTVTHHSFAAPTHWLQVVS